MKTRNVTRKIFAIVLAAAMIVAMSAVTFADGTDYTFPIPTEPMSTDDNVIKGASIQAGTGILDIMGMNDASGTTTNPEPTTLAAASTTAGLGYWGTKLNSTPDPYVWNRLYNFYASENGLETVKDAMTVAADSGEAYGLSTGALCNRPDIYVLFGGTDLSDSIKADLATINAFTPDSEYYQKGDETYNPLVFSGYDSSNMGSLLTTMDSLADTMNAYTEETGKVARVQNPSNIPAKFSKYVYGLLAYVQEHLDNGTAAKKTIATIALTNDDGTYCLGSTPKQGSSTGHPTEFIAMLANNYGDTEGLETKEVTSESRRGTTTTVYPIATVAQLNEGTDAILGWADMNWQKTKMTDFIDNAGYTGNFSSYAPAGAYGITANTVEIALGYAYTAGYLYFDQNIGLNPVELFAYYYETFCNITDRDAIQQMLNVNFANASLPEGCSTTLPSDYSAAKVEKILDEGVAYYKAHATEEAFTNYPAQITGISGWNSTGFLADLETLETQKCVEHAYYYDEEKGTAKCVYCGQTIIDCDHNMIYHAAKEATETESGNTEYWTCSVCGKYFSDAEGKNEIEKDSWIIPAKGKDTSVAGFVKRLYSECLDRDAEESGLNYWCENLLNGSFTGTDTGYYFIFSNEFKTKYYCNECFLKHLYTAFMGREYDDGGLNYWLGCMKDGMTRETVFNSFAGSNEFKKICADYGIVVGDSVYNGDLAIPYGNCKGCGVSNGIADFVKRLYADCLDRPLDQEGLEYWCNGLYTGQFKGISTARNFFFSEEFLGKGYDDTEFIKHLYTVLMGRDFDEDGLNYWVNRIQNGDTWENAFYAFAGCDEFAKICSDYGITLK